MMDFSFYKVTIRFEGPCIASSDVLVLEVCIREARPAHVQNSQDVLLDVLRERHAGDTLDHLAQDEIAEIGVGIVRTRLEGEPVILVQEPPGQGIECYRWLIC
jgi:hypothetical protein